MPSVSTNSECLVSPPSLESGLSGPITFPSPFALLLAVSTLSVSLMYIPYVQHFCQTPWRLHHKCHAYIRSASLIFGFMVLSGLGHFAGHMVCWLRLRFSYGWCSSLHQDIPIPHLPCCSLSGALCLLGCVVAVYLPTFCASISSELTDSVIPARFCPLSCMHSCAVTLLSDCGVAREMLLLFASVLSTPA